LLNSVTDLTRKVASLDASVAAVLATAAQGEATVDEQPHTLVGPVNTQESMEANGLPPVQPMPDARDVMARAEIADADTAGSSNATHGTLVHSKRQAKLDDLDAAPAGVGDNNGQPGPEVSIVPRTAPEPGLAPPLVLVGSEPDTVIGLEDMGQKVMEVTREDVAEGDPPLPVTADGHDATQNTNQRQRGAAKANLLGAAVDVAVEQGTEDATSNKAHPPLPLRRSEPRPFDTQHSGQDADRRPVRHESLNDLHAATEAYAKANVKSKQVASDALSFVTKAGGGRLRGGGLAEDEGPSVLETTGKRSVVGSGVGKTDALSTNTRYRRIGN
jgi:hypothetical protein